MSRVGGAHHIGIRGFVVAVRDGGSALFALVRQHLLDVRHCHVGEQRSHIRYNRVVSVIYAQHVTFVKTILKQLGLQK